MTSLVVLFDALLLAVDEGDDPVELESLLSPPRDDVIDLPASAALMSPTDGCQEAVAVMGRLICQIRLVLRSGGTEQDILEQAKTIAQRRFGVLDSAGGVLRSPTLTKAMHGIGDG